MIPWSPPPQKSLVEYPPLRRGPGRGNEQGLSSTDSVCGGVYSSSWPICIRPILITRFHCKVAAKLLPIGVGRLFQISGLARRDDAEEVAQLLHLEVLLAQVLQVPLGEGGLGGDVDLVLLAADGDLVAEVAGLAVDLDAVLQELLEVLGSGNAIMSTIQETQTQRS